MCDSYYQTSHAIIVKLEGDLLLPKPDDEEVINIISALIACCKCISLNNEHHPF